MKSKTPRSPAKNNSAFSILEVMVVAGLMSIVGLSITSVVTNSTKSQKRIELKDGQISTTNQIRNVLQNAAFCANAFCTGGATCAGSGPNNTLTLTGLPQAGPVAANFKIDLQGIQVFSGQTAAQNIASCTTDCGNGSADEQPPEAGPYGTPVGNTGLYIYKMRLINFTYQGTIGGNHVSLADLQVRFTRDPKRTVGGQFQDSVIKLVISATSGGANAGRIVSCSTGAGDSLWQESTANVNDIFFNTGEVGIGTDDPRTRLHVMDGIQIEAVAGPFLHLRRNATNEWFQVATAAGADRFDLRAGNIASAPLTTVTTAGDMGIGTAAPASKLHVVGDIAGAGDLRLIGGNRAVITDANADLTLTSQGAGSVALRTAGTNRLLVNQAGLVAISGAATIGTTLGVTGTTTLSDHLTVAANGAGITGTLSVSQLATFSNGITVSASGASITGNTAVTGATSLNGNLAVSGTSTIPTLSGAITHNGGFFTGGGAAQEIVNYGAYRTTSDRRYKKNIVPLPAQTELIKKVPTYTYNYIEDKEESQHYGVIAQDLLEIYPGLVRASSNGYLNVNYPELIPILIKGFQESNQRIEKLEAEIQTLKDLIKSNQH